ncbi:MAG: thioredoxin family protein [Oscillospiraceae bacterium]|jgi:thioredoxin 1|nr:thioredoxin family protein [Oscillospiraceae bacterium]
MPIEKLTKNEFYEKAYTAQQPVLIEFFMPECSYCKEFEPVLHEVGSVEDKKIFTVNIEEEKELSEYYRIMSVPTTIALKQGAIVTRCLGSLKKETVLDMFDMASA